MLQAATAALAACGFRAARDAHHFRVLQSLRLTIGADAMFVAQLDQFRKKRNIGSYERIGSVSEQETEEMLALAERLHVDLNEWLRANHPELFVRRES